MTKAQYDKDLELGKLEMVQDARYQEMIKAEFPYIMGVYAIGLLFLAISFLF